MALSCASVGLTWSVKKQWILALSRWRASFFACWGHIMKNGLLERLTALDSITDPDELTAAIEQLINGIGFDYYRLAIIIPVSNQRPIIRILNSCPNEWIEHYNRHGMIARDPVISAARSQTRPIRWEELHGSDEQMDVMVEAAKCGLRCGVSYPLHGPKGESGVMSFITEQFRPGLYIEATPTLALVVPYVLDAVLRACRPTSSRPLTIVESDCLFWVSEGKTSAEISIIMGIPERTVTHHLNSAGRKLGAANRYNAVARALRSRELDITLDRAKVIDHANHPDQADAGPPPAPGECKGEGEQAADQASARPARHSST